MASFGHRSLAPLGSPSPLRKRFALPTDVVETRRKRHKQTESDRRKRMAIAVAGMRKLLGLSSKEEQAHVLEVAFATLQSCMLPTPATKRRGACANASSPTFEASTALTPTSDLDLPGDAPCHTTAGQGPSSAPPSPALPFSFPPPCMEAEPQPAAHASRSSARRIPMRPAPNAQLPGHGEGVSAATVCRSQNALDILAATAVQCRSSAGFLASTQDLDCTS